MSVDIIVILLLWIILPLTLIVIIPRHRIRESVAAFLLFQTLTWVFSIGLSYFGFLASPVRLFENATNISFTSEYLVFPTAAVLFQLWYPNGSRKIRRAFHYVLSVGGILLFMCLLGSFTNIMTVKLDNLIRSAFNFTIELWLCRRYMVWLMKKTILKRPVVVKEI
jgi:hypothetical protein